MGDMGLTLCTVQSTIVSCAKNMSPEEPTHMCDLSRWQPDWVAISQVHKRIAIIDRCRPPDVLVHREQLHAAAIRKQEGCLPPIYANTITKAG